MLRHFFVCILICMTWSIHILARSSSSSSSSNHHPHSALQPDIDQPTTNFNSEEVDFYSPPYDSSINMLELSRTSTSVTYGRRCNNSMTITFPIDDDDQTDYEPPSRTSLTESSSSPSSSSFISTSTTTLVTGCGKDKCKTKGPWQTMCEESLCYPLCLSVYDVQVKGGKGELKTQLAEPKHQTAIQGLLVAIGCEKAKCCKKSDRLATWAESKIQGPDTTALPLPYCMHMKDRKAACKACKSVKVTVKPKGKERCENFYKPFKVTGAKAAYKRGKSEPNKEKHLSYKERCLAVGKEIKGSMGSAMTKYVCGCLGCCDDQVCPYKIAHSSVDEAVKSKK